MTAVCDMLRERCKSIWDGLHTAPFVAEMAAGTLPERKFAFYISQNVVFLRELARAMALGVAKADDEATMRRFALIVTNIMDLELPKNRELLERVLTMVPEATGDVEMAPATLAYTRHLLTVAYEGRAAEIIASLVPCSWSYGEIGIERTAEAADHPVYKPWFEFFAGREYWDALEQVKSQLEELCDGASDADLTRLTDIFRTSCRLEQEFWDAAYVERTWTT
jgi:thiaminase (transcriptional activator TenA)